MLFKHCIIMTFCQNKKIKPDMIIAKALFLNQPNIIKALQFKNNLQNVFFILSNEGK